MWAALPPEHLFIHMASTLVQVPITSGLDTGPTPDPNGQWPENAHEHESGHTPPSEQRPKPALGSPGPEPLPSHLPALISCPLTLCPFVHSLYALMV